METRLWVVFVLQSLHATERNTLDSLGDCTGCSFFDHGYRATQHPRSFSQGSRPISFTRRIWTSTPPLCEPRTMFGGRRIAAYLLHEDFGESRSAAEVPRRLYAPDFPFCFLLISLRKYPPKGTTNSSDGVHCVVTRVRMDLRDRECFKRGLAS